MLTRFVPADYPKESCPADRDLPNATPRTVGALRLSGQFKSTEHTAISAYDDAYLSICPWRSRNIITDSSDA
ncbi:hypothetical protein POX_d05599 [Penicillium oxalicum]|uniref:hypothetical protein n=1 Tax=Penicillium oxalicum TaxID=69781 RepID=UPI0020B713F0|nr:hypothetical protein POX_d05599 [Penicillium oxalicum]KAI2790095.1 hypothetical protein POX_d05599 [Penicillium oxalicum]